MKKSYLVIRPNAPTVFRIMDHLWDFMQWPEPADAYIPAWSAWARKPVLNAPHGTKR